MTRINQSGFKRNDTNPMRPKYNLIPTWALERLAVLYAEGASKFGENNWKLANREEDLSSFHESMMRHMIQYVNNEKNEDHFARIIWNLIGMEHVRRQKEIKQTKE